jgi:hypothetical protein
LPLVPHDEGRPIGDIANSLLDGVEVATMIDPASAVRWHGELFLRAADGAPIEVSTSIFSVVGRTSTVELVALAACGATRHGG